MRSGIYICLIAAILLTGCKGDPSSGEVWGIDISKHQRNVNWGRVFSENPPHFVFLKATEGTLIVDPSYARHARQLDSMGALWGAYHFFGHRTDGREQARNFIRTAKLRRGNLIPVLDIEPHRFMTDSKKSVVQAKRFCDEVRRYYGVDPIIYCSTNFYERYLREDFPASRYVLWIADYRSCPHHLDWCFWQHTDSHRVRGIGGSVDRNVFTLSPEHLKRLTL